MKKAIIGIMVLMAITLAAVGYATYGNSWEVGRQSGLRDGSHYEQMHEIMESGTYQDLLDLREELGRPVKRWIQSEEDFAQAQENFACDGDCGMRSGCPFH